MRRARSREYRAWEAAKRRCYVPGANRFKRYGGRGIVMCSKWRDSFEAFLADMGKCPKGSSIDRINNDGDYEPGNCRWATAREQGANTSRSVIVVLDGERMIQEEAARRLGISSSAIILRRKRATQYASR